MAEPINPSPKQQLLSNIKQRAAHNELVADDQMRGSLNLALLEYQGRLMYKIADGNAAATIAYRIQGALEFINEFLYLGREVKPIETTTTTQQIDHNVK